MLLKTFDVVVDSEESILQHMNVMKSYIGQLRAVQTQVTKKQQMFDSCIGILNSDISHVYSDLRLDPAPVYYTYAHLDPSRKVAIGKNGITTFAATLGMDNFPFYIGKGRGNRAYQLNRNETHRKICQRIRSFDKEPIVFIIKSNLTELDALAYESKLIDIFGLLPNGGRLANLDEGINKEERRQVYFQHLAELNRLYQNSV